ncbi:hypothetical protein ES703_92477 [subsurface metagenome]
MGLAQIGSSRLLSLARLLDGALLLSCLVVQCLFYSVMELTFCDGVRYISRRVWKSEHEVIDWFIDSGSGAGGYRIGIAGSVGVENLHLLALSSSLLKED